MRPITLFAGAALALTAPAAAQAGCPQRTTGTVVGAVAGGLLGNAVAGHGARTEGTVLGAGVGGLVGNQVTKCPRYAGAHPHRARHAEARRSKPTRYAAACRYEQRAYYDPYGEVVRQPIRVCGR